MTGGLCEAGKELVYANRDNALFMGQSEKGLFRKKSVRTDKDAPDDTGNKSGCYCAWNIKT